MYICIRLIPTKKGICYNEWIFRLIINVYDFVLVYIGRKTKAMKLFIHNYISLVCTNFIFSIYFVLVVPHRNTQNLPFIITLLFKYRKQDIILLVTIISPGKHIYLYCLLCYYYHFIILLLDTFSAPNFNVGTVPLKN